MTSQALEILQTLGAELCLYTASNGTAKKVWTLIGPVRRTDVLGSVEFLSKTYELWIVKSATEGVTSIKEGYDTVAVRLQPSDPTLTTLRITKIYPEWDVGIPGDGTGLWHVEAVI